MADGAIAFSLLLLMNCNSASAKDKTVEVGEDGLRLMKTTLTLPQTTNLLNVELTNVDYVIRHEDRKDIEVRTNYPDHWSVDDNGMVKQIKYANCPMGYYHTQNGKVLIGQGTTDDTGTRIEMTPDGIRINGKKLKLESKVTRPGVHGMEMNTSGMFINGRRVANGSADPKADKEIDALQIIVPNDFAGSLDLKSTSRFGGTIDGWSGDSLSVTNLGTGSIWFKSIIKSKCALNADLKGKIDVDAIDSPSADLHAQSAGKINVKYIKTGNAKVTSSEKGEIEIAKAEVETFTGNASAQSAISLGGWSDGENFKVSKVELSSKDNGTIKLVSGDVQTCSVTTMNDGKVDLHGSFSQIEEPNGSAGGITIRPAVIEKSENKEQTQ